jgi:hypothetical protein
MCSTPGNTLVATALQGVLNSVGTSLDSALGRLADLPLIGGKLHDLAQTEVRSLAGTFDQLLATNGVHQNPDCSLSVLLETDFSTSSDFSLGLPLLDLKADSKVQVNLGFYYLLNFTLDAQGRPTINTHADLMTDPTVVSRHLNLTHTPFAVSLDVTLPGFRASGSLGGLLYVTAGDHGGTGFHAALGTGLNLDGSFQSLKITGGANVDFDLTLQFADPKKFPNLPFNPKFGAEFQLTWDFPNVDADSVSQSSFGTLSHVGFKNISIDVGQLFNGFIGNIITKVQQLTKQFQPVVDLSHKEVPILNDFGVHITVRQLLEQAGALAPGLGNALDAIGIINGLQPSGHGTITLGSFTLPDIRGARAIPIPGGDVLDRSSLLRQLNSLSSNFFDQIAEQQDIGLHFPIADDPVGTVFKLFVGQDVPLFTYTMPTFNFPIQATLGWDFGIFGLYLRGKIDTRIDLSVGYDTKGLRDLFRDLPSATAGTLVKDVLRGFYVDNTPSNATDDEGHTYRHHNTGVDVQGKLSAALSLGVTVSGGITAHLSASLNEVNNEPLTVVRNGQSVQLQVVRLDKIIDTLAGSPECVVGFQGDVTASADISVGLDLGPVSFHPFHYTLAEVTLARFDTTCHGSGGGGSANSDTITVDTSPGHNTIYVQSYQRVQTIGQGMRQYDSGIEVVYPDEVRYYRTSLWDISYPVGRDTTLVSRHHFSTINNNLPNSGNYKVIVDPSRVDYTDVDGIHTLKTGVTLANQYDPDWAGTQVSLSGGPGDNDFEVSKGTFNGALGTVTLRGGAGDNTLIGGDVEYADPTFFLYGPHRKNVLIGAASGSTLYGGQGTNYLKGGGTLEAHGKTEMHGGIGDNAFVAWAGDRVYGSGSGINTLHYLNSAPFPTFGGPPPTETFTLSADPNAVDAHDHKPALDITETGGAPTVAYDITSLILDGSIDPNHVDPNHPVPATMNVTINDLSGTSVQTVALTGDVGTVTVKGSRHSDQFMDVKNYDRNESMVVVGRLTYPTRGVLLPEENPTLAIVMRGLSDTSKVVLDGGTSGAQYSVYLSPQDAAFTTTVRTSAPAGQDALSVDGSALPHGSEDVTDSLVQFNWGVNQGRYQATFHRSVQIEGYLDKIGTVAPNGGETIDATLGYRKADIFSGFGNSTFNVTTAADVTLEGGGNDTFNIYHALSRSVHITVGEITGVNATLHVNDRVNAAGQAIGADDLGSTYTLTTGRVERVGKRSSVTGPVSESLVLTYSHIANLIITGTSYHNSFTLQYPMPSSAITVNAGNYVDSRGNGDSILVGDFEHVIDGNWSLAVHGGTGTHLTVDDDVVANHLPGRSTSTSYYVGSQGVERDRGLVDLLTSPPTTLQTQRLFITYTHLARLQILGATSGDSYFHVTGTGPGTETTLTTGPGARVVLGGVEDNLDAIGTLHIDGGTGTTLTLDDRGNQNRQTGYSNGGIELRPTPTYRVTSDAVTRDDKVDRVLLDHNIVSSTTHYVSTITYSGIASLEIDGGQTANTFVVQGTMPAIPVTVHGGRSGGDTLQGPDAANTWLLTGSNAGKVNDRLTFNSIANLVGGSSTDVFRFQPGGSVSGKIDGGGGTNTLDYSADTGNIVVDLQTSAATGVGTAGVANIQNVIGANGGPAGSYNILVGNGGNVLTGGRGRRNLLIAGARASTLQSGDGDDLIIGGTTSYDREAGLASLLAIMREWASTDPYSTRVDKLTHGKGVPLLDATKVHNNGGGNTFQRNGTGVDLFFASIKDRDSWRPNASETFLPV